VTDIPRAADLPDRSIVVNDLVGHAWYASHDDSDGGRWKMTGGQWGADDTDIDEQLALSATVLRVGDGSEEN
jgi:hypothetical protein